MWKNAYECLQLYQNAHHLLCVLVQPVVSYCKNDLNHNIIIIIILLSVL
jgi:hypothetical protein